MMNKGKWLRLRQQAIDNGNLIQFGWALFRDEMCPEPTPYLLKASELAFYAGAQHAFSSLSNAEFDDRTLSMINKELNTWFDGWKPDRRHTPERRHGAPAPQGKAIVARAAGDRRMAG